MTLHLPATTSLISITKQRNAAAAGGGLHTLQFVIAGAYVQATPAGVHSRLGVGGFMTLLAGLVVLAALGAGLAQARARQELGDSFGACEWRGCGRRGAWSGRPRARTGSVLRGCTQR